MRKNSLAENLKLLEAISLAVRSGAVDPLAKIRQKVENQNLPVGANIWGILALALDQGDPLFASIEAFTSEVIKAQEDHEGLAQLMHLVQLRVMIVLVIGSVGRLFFLQKILSSLTLVDVIGLDGLSAIIVVIFGLYALKYYIPQHWLWNGAWTALGQSWLYSSLSGIANPNDPWFLEFECLLENELTFGIGLSRERRRVLKSFSRQKRVIWQKVLKNIEDLLPLWELAILGLAVVLLIAIPASHWIVQQN